MGILTSLFRDPEASADGSGFKPWDDFWYENLRGVGNSIGIRVTPLVALQVAAVFACVKVISETLASLPLIVYKRRADGRGRDRATDHPLYELLHYSPNEWQTALEFVDDQQGHASLYGNCYAEILPGSAGSVVELVPLHPERVTVEQLASRRLRYHVREANGSKRALTQDQVFHVRGRSLDFVNGLATHTQARDAIALARAVEMYSSRFFANDASVGVAIEHPGTLSDEAYKRLKEEFTGSHVGLGNAHKPTILEEGMKVSRLAMSAAKDSQLTESQEAAVIMICRYFRMPPHKIQHLLHATFSNIEHQGIEFVTDTIMPWARRWETRISASLLMDRDHFAEFLFAGLLRGDNAARAAYYAARFNIGTLSPNDIRDLENENPIEDESGDKYYLQGALVPLDQAGKVAAVPPQLGGPPAPPNQDGSGTDAPTPADDTPPAGATEASAGPLRAFRVLIQDAAERISRAEVRELERRAAKASADPPRFAAWRNTFYLEHATYVGRTLQPLASAWEDETGNPVDVEQIVASVLCGAYALPGDFAAWAEARPRSIVDGIAYAFLAASAPAPIRSVRAQVLTAEVFPDPTLAAIASLERRVSHAIELASRPPNAGGVTNIQVDAGASSGPELPRVIAFERDAKGAVIGATIVEELHTVAQTVRGKRRHVVLSRDARGAVVGATVTEIPATLEEAVR